MGTFPYVSQIKTAIDHERCEMRQPPPNNFILAGAQPPLSTYFVIVSSSLTLFISIIYKMDTIILSMNRELIQNKSSRQTQ